MVWNTVNLFAYVWRLTEGPEGVGGVAGDEGVGCNVFGDDATGAYDGSVADCHAWYYGHVGGYPYVVAYGYGLCFHYACVALVVIEGVCDGAQCGVGAYEDVVAYRDFGLIEYCEVEVADEVIAYFDVETKVAVEW